MMSQANRQELSNGNSMKKWLLLFITLMIAPSQVFAFACYTPEELRAEQLLRLHSELMVITVACHTGSQGENLVPAYTGFTKENIATLHAAEQTLIRFYAMQYGDNGIAELDTLRTKLGNEYGQSMADISAPVFCSQERDKVLALYRATPQQLATEVLHMTANEKSYAPLCHTEVASGTKN